jgi:anti-anti-sigma regulatory factor
MDNLNIPNSRQSGNTVILDLTGYMRLGDKVSEFHETANKVHAEGGTLVLNFSQVTRIDSSMTGEMARAHGKLDGAFGIYGMSEKVRGYLKIQKLDTVFHIYDTEKEALAKTPSGRLPQSPQVSGATTQLSSAHL